LIARKLVSALETGGCSVWWDGLLEGGERFSKTTATALEKAEVVVVLWSKTSLESHWVHDEATHGRDKGRLVPVSIDGSEAPLGFRQFQLIDLSKWKGKTSGAEIANLLRAVAIAAGQRDVAPPAPVASTSFPSRRALIVAGGGVAVAAMGGGFAAWQLGWLEPEGITNSVAVLPFKNLSGDSAQDYFSDGLTEEIRATLSRNQLLRVVASTSSMMFRDRVEPVPEIAKKLDVAYLLDGSVRRAGDLVKISAELVDGATGSTSWSRSIETTLAKALDGQYELADTIARVLTAQVEGRGVKNVAKDHHRSGGTSNIAAFEAYLQGREIFVKQSDPIASLVKIDAAIEIDPNYAAAHAERARMLTHSGRNAPALNESKSLFQSAIASARRAIQIAPDFALAHSHLGFALTYGRMSVAEARAPYERSRELGWGDAHVVLSYAVYLSTIGKHEDALRVFKRAIAIDPLNNKWLTTLIYIQTEARKYDEALSTAKLIIDRNIENTLIFAYWTIITVHIYKNEFKEADKNLKKYFPDIPNHYLYAIIEHRNKNYDRAQQVLSNFMDEAGEFGFISAAQISAFWGEKDRALSALENAYSLGDYAIVDKYSNPFFDPLRKESRFIALFKKMGFG
jgi:TolB-like protein/Tfp pilus assembly protein PilF